MTDPGSEHIADLKRKILEGVAIEEVIGRDERLIRSGREYKALCPFHNDRSPSMSVVPSKGFYHCFACGAHGDVITYVRHRHGLGFVEAVEALVADYGLAGAPARHSLRAKPLKRDPRKDSAEQQRDEEKARALFERTTPAAGTLAEEYLTRRVPDLRCVDRRVLQQLRFTCLDYYYEIAPAEEEKRPKEHDRWRVLGRFPAMVAPVQTVTGVIKGVHITFLAADGSGKLRVCHPHTGERLPAKKMRGTVWGGAIRLGPAAESMAVSEGIENGLTFLAAKPDTPLWVAGSLGNIAGIGVGQGPPHPSPKRPGQLLPSEFPDLAHPGIALPAEVKELWLISDNDSKDQPSADCLINRACRRFSQLGLRVRLIKPPAGKDLNDVALEAGHG